MQEHVILNPDDVNKYMVPIRHTTYETELTVGSGIRCISFDQFDGGTDLGYNRMNFRWGNVGTFQISPGSHMWQVANKYYKRRQANPDYRCALACRRHVRCLRAPASTMPFCRWAAMKSALPARCRAAQFAW